MTVYLIRDPGTENGAGALKIGFCADVSVTVHRLRSIQQSCASTLEVVEEIPGAGRDLEHELHARLDAHRLHRPDSEWFEDCIEVRQQVHIASLEAQLSALDRSRRLVRPLTPCLQGAPSRDKGRGQLLDVAHAAPAPERAGHVPPPPGPGDLSAADVPTLAAALSDQLVARFEVTGPESHRRAIECVDQADLDLRRVETLMRTTIEPRVRLALISEMAERTLTRRPPAAIRLRHHVRDDLSAAGDTVTPILRPVKEAA
ncbi:GIY-YIG nuclease family protein [Acidipropionibacterium acidipropionici]|uniref:GIY-YIG nuclease family protein n=1 Tax=Acidipropionibacterium acidipropionici TaxID=1748 RepID=UPI0003F5D53E|nr:GIY-YIG nuclease family protein [Acidipropionibacterium acidipropionici]ALN14344.1 hypothetical protein ASQ49_02635 [Acidipropionibacterium acidipropionici]APZ09893.1 hypothetical protein BWX38_12315 [Acidipropionibacterium acidipropionici]